MPILIKIHKNKANKNNVTFRNLSCLDNIKSFKYDVSIKWFNYLIRNKKYG